MRLVPVQRGIEIRAAGEDERVQELECLFDAFLARRDEQRPPACVLDRVDVVRGNERGLLLPRAEGRGGHIGRDADDRSHRLRNVLNPLPLRQTGEREDRMTLKLGDTAPDFDAQTTEGPISFHEWLGDSWAVLFSHPKDFTPVCTTELGYMARIKPEFDKRNGKIIGLSVDSADDHERWAKDIEETQGEAPNYPIIGDPDFSISKAWGMLPEEVSGDPKDRTPADNQTVRNVFVVGPDKKIKLILIYPMTTGRNFDEVLRVIDSLQLTATHKVATPVNWRQGDDVIIAGSVSDDDAKEIFGEWESPKPYIRIVPQPDTEMAKS